MLAIQQIVALYSHTYDSGDAEDWANLFTKDGVWEFYPAGATTPSTRLKGHAEIKAFCEQKEMREKSAGVKSYHHQTSVVFDELTAKSAHTRVMVVITVWNLKENKGHIFMTGVYNDVLKKTPQGWRFAYRRLTP